jgi:hypothetical protein
LSSVKPIPAVPHCGALILQSKPQAGEKWRFSFYHHPFFATGSISQILLNIFYPATLAAHNEPRMYGPAMLLDSVFFDTVLFGLTLFVFGTSSLLVHRYGRRDLHRKDVSMLLATNAFIRALPSVIISWTKIAKDTSFAQQANRLLSTVSSGAATIRAQIRQGAKLRLKQYR